MEGPKDRITRMAEAYDEEADATGWVGPEIAFGLAYAHVRPGEAILDIGIGTGLSSVLFRKAGLNVLGMDVSMDMLDVCRVKGFTELVLHDLEAVPYPYGTTGIDHAVCIGVMNFFGALTAVFRETARILREGGVFVFCVGDRTEEEDPRIVVGPEHTMSDRSMTMYRHSAGQIDDWLSRFGFTCLKSLEFTVFMDRERTRRIRSRMYLAKKTAPIK